MMNGSGTKEFEIFLSGHKPLSTLATFHDGELLGEWRITAFLGKGGSGEVYRAEHVKDSRSVALKVHVRQSGKSDSQENSARARFEREARILSRNTYSFFPKFYEFGEARGYLYFAIELLEPISLPTTDTTIASFLLELCRAVRVLHGSGLVHRDIKPQNIMRRANGQLVLIDLGLVKESASFTDHSGTSVTIVDGKVVGVGTPRYAAPEQFNGGVVSPATDIHALGMLANECFGGRPPRAWERIISRSTSSIPERRYADVHAFATAICHRHIGRIFLGSAVGLLAIVGAILITVFESRDIPQAKLVTEGDDQSGVQLLSTPTEPEGTSGMGRSLGILSEKAQSPNVATGSPRSAQDSQLTRVPSGRGQTPSMASTTQFTSHARYPVTPQYTTWRSLATDVQTNIVERQVLYEKHSTNDFGAVMMTERAWRNVTNSVAGTTLHLEGRKHRFEEPILLEPNRHYWVVGPGTLDAAIEGLPGSRIYLDNCVLVNRTKKPLRECGIRYIFRKGSYLNFINQERNDDYRLYIEDFDGAYNALEFQGPESVAELIRRRDMETRRLLELDRQ